LGIAVSPSSHELLVSDHVTYALYGFNENTANQYSPAPVSPYSLTSSTGLLESIAIRPDGKFVYVVGLSGGIDGLAVVGDGSVAAITGSPFPVATGSVEAITDSSGKFLFVVNSSTVSVFTIDRTTGSLSAAGSPVPLPTATLATPGMAITTPGPGNFLYIALTGAKSVAAFSFDTTGTLTPVSGSPFAVGSAPLTVTATAQAVYVMNAFDNTISALAWDRGTGQLAPISGSPFDAQGGLGEMAPLNGQYLYAAGPNAIAAFSISSSGALTPLSGSPFPAGAQLKGALTAF
jgi:6-phosphogluconolactonase (cycloisomerase 2 family)